MLPADVKTAAEALQERIVLRLPGYVRRRGKAGFVVSDTDHSTDISRISEAHSTIQQYKLGARDQYSDTAPDG